MVWKTNPNDPHEEKIYTFGPDPWSTEVGTLTKGDNKGCGRPGI